MRKRGGRERNRCLANRVGGGEGVGEGVGVVVGEGVWGQLEGVRRKKDD